MGAPLLASPRVQGGESDGSGRWVRALPFPALVTHGAPRRPRAVYIPFQGSTVEEALRLPNRLTLLQKPPPGSPSG